MRKSSLYIHEGSEVVSDNDTNIALEHVENSLCRIRHIERLLGVRIMQTPNEVLSHDVTVELNHHEQVNQLLRAFEFISDAKVRADVLAIVIAAAQHENTLD